jgi:hypothetical protein
MSTEGPALEGPMEYRGIEYSIRAGIEKTRWFWTANTLPDKPLSGEVKGSKARAEIAARQAIDRWLLKNPRAGRD